MARLYLNPAARIPNEIAISGNVLIPEAGAAVIDPTAAFQQDFYEQAIATKVSDGSQVPAYTTTFSKLAAMLDAKPGWMLAPQLATDPLENLGSFTGYGNAELKNGATLSETALVTGTVSAALDGTNDYIDTGWATRTNQCIAPMPGEKTGLYSQATSQAEIAKTRDTSWTDLGLSSIRFAGKTATSGYTEVSFTGPNGGGTAKSPVTAGTTYVVQTHVKINAWGGLLSEMSPRMIIRWYKADGTTLISQVEKSGFAKELGEQTIYYVGAAPAEAAYCVPYLYFDGGSSGAHNGRTYDIQFDGIDIRAGLEVETRGPRQADLESGLAGWSGTAHESVSTIGPVGNGLTRTIAGMASRTSTATADVLVGGLSAPVARMILRLEAGGQNVEFWTRSSEGGLTWAAAWPGNEQAVFWALVIDETANEAELFINGVSKGRQGYGAVLFDTSQKLGIGSDTLAPFAGSLLPFALYPRALSGAEILAIYSGP